MPAKPPPSLTRLGSPASDASSRGLRPVRQRNHLVPRHAVHTSQLGAPRETPLSPMLHTSVVDQAEHSGSGSLRAIPSATGRPSQSFPSSTRRQANTCAWLHQATTTATLAAVHLGAIQDVAPISPRCPSPNRQDRLEKSITRCRRHGGFSAERRYEPWPRMPQPGDRHQSGHHRARPLCQMARQKKTVSVGMLV